VTILRTEGITKNFAKFTALGGISLEVKKGEIRSIIGPNGAGKTTFFNVVTGKFRPTKGRVYFDGEDITGKSPYEIVRYGIARTFQIINVFADLTVLENIMLPVLTKQRRNMDFFSPPQVQEDIMEKSFKIIKEIGLQEHAHAVAGNLSHGDKKKVDIGIALAQDPKIFLLDEPTAGLNPRENQNTIDLIKTIAVKQNLTIILIEHDMNAVFSISDSITVFQHGVVIAEGKPEEVRQDKLVIEAYLGEEF
jgi:branched-chain amino acid transport system ATP-binding protein